MKLGITLPEMSTDEWRMLHEELMHLLAQGYVLAKTDEQVEKVKTYEKEIKDRLARMSKMLDEILKG